MKTKKPELDNTPIGDWNHEMFGDVTLAYHQWYQATQNNKDKLHTIDNIANTKATEELIYKKSLMSEKDILIELLRDIQFSKWQVNDMVDDKIANNRCNKIVKYLEEKIKTADTEEK